MTQPSNAVTLSSQILDDVEQISNEIFVEKNPTNSIENQISKEMKNGSWLSNSLKSLERQPPLRPLTAYNIYFQLQRERIMNGDEESSVKFTEQDVIGVIQDRYNNWAGTNVRERNKDYEKNSKKYTFGEFATKIAAKWKAADEETKALMRLYSKKQREDYYRLKYASDAATDRPVVRLECDKAPPPKSPRQNSAPTPTTPRQTVAPPPRKISSASDFSCFRSTVSAPSYLETRIDTARRNNRDEASSFSDTRIDDARNSSRAETLIKKGNIMNFDEDDWDNDLLVTNQQPNMVEMDQQRSQASTRRVSVDGGFGVQQYQMPSYRLQPPTTAYTMMPQPCSPFSMGKYNRYMLWKKRIQYQRQENMMAYKKAQMKYYQNLRELQNAYKKLKVMSTIQYNHVVFPDRNVSTADDTDYFLDGVGDDDEDDIDTTVDDIFIQPPPPTAERSSYFDRCNDVTGHGTHMTEEGNYEVSYAMEDNDSSFLQMKPRPTVSMNSFENMSENIFDHDHDDDDDFSVM